METLKYYVTENPLGNGFMAKTIVKDNLNVEDFVRKICQINGNLDERLVKETLKTLSQAAEIVLSEGNAITVTEFLRITPVIKGPFGRINDNFDPASNYIGIACTVLPKFIREFQSKVSVEKTGKPANMPQILFINNNRDDENSFKLRYENKILGVNFTYSNYKLKGINIINAEDRTKFVMLDGNSIEITDMKAREIRLHIDREFNPPDWLTDDLGILVQLVYESVDQPVVKEKLSDMFESVWDSRK